MKDYIDQIFYEGLGRTVYYPLEKVIDKIKNKNIRNLIKFIVKLLYFIVAIIIAGVLFYFVL